MFLLKINGIFIYVIIFIGMKLKVAILSILPGVLTLIRMEEVGNQQLIMTNVKKNERVKLI